MAGPTNTQFAVAVHVLTYLAGAGGERPVSSDELSGSANVNPVHIRRVLGPLREAGVVGSRAGAHGGWVLCREAAALHLDEIWDLVNGADPVVGSHGPNPSCPVGRGVGEVLLDIDAAAADAVRASLHGRTVADVVREAVGTTRGVAR